MKRIVTLFSLALVLVFPKGVHATEVTPSTAGAAAVAPATTAPQAAKAEDFSALPLEARQEKVYTELSAVSARLGDIASRLEVAATALGHNNIDISAVTPLIDKTKVALGLAGTNLLALAPAPQTVATTQTPTPTAFSAKMAAPVTETPKKPTEEELKATALTIETNLTNAKQSLLDAITILKALVKAQTQN